MISAAGSGCGKSVVTMGLLQALKERGIALQSFKCGPDYIDPGFHERVLGVPCRNLDTFLMGEDEVLEEVSDAERSGFLCVAEGAMGLFDGLGGRVAHSAYRIASLCRMPVLVVVDAGREESCAWQLERLLEKDENDLICGVLINRCTAENYPGIIREMEGLFHHDSADRPLILTGGEKGVCLDCGYLPPMTEAVFPSRHLGLVGAALAEDFPRRVRRIAAALEKSGCADAALALAGNARGHLKTSSGIQQEDPFMAVPFWSGRRREPEKCPEGTGPVRDRSRTPRAEDRRKRCRIAVAMDSAFSFVYRRSLENLEKAGAELAFFSPLSDPCLPADSDGLYLPGGYPELYASSLEENDSMRRSVREAVRRGTPTVAECGGFLYLGEVLCGEDGHPYQMAGVLPGRSSGQGRLVRFGYLELQQEKGDSLLFREGETVAAHEFHYWDSTCSGEDLLARKRSNNREWRCGYARKNLYAAFPHLYLNAVRAERFTAACEAYRQHSGGRQEESVWHITS